MTPPPSQIQSVFFWQQDRRGTSVGLSDDPDLDAVGDHVRRQQARPFDQRPIIRPRVVGAHDAPVTGRVAFEIRPEAPSHPDSHP